MQEIVIDPGQAFGTGAHASTRLCLELLLELGRRAPGGALLDVGTGSGVLAIAAARLGFSPVLGLDNERESVDAAQRRTRPSTGRRSTCAASTCASQALPWLSGDRQAPRGWSCVANLLRPLLLELARRIATRAPAHLIAGGLLREEVDEVVGCVYCRASCGLRERERREGGEWAAVWLPQRPIASASCLGSGISVAARTIAR